MPLLLIYNVVCYCCYTIYTGLDVHCLQPKVNEQPVVEVGKKRPANDENLDPASSSSELPPSKQPRTIDIDLPNRWEDFTNSENIAKGEKTQM